MLSIDRVIVRALGTNDQPISLILKQLGLPPKDSDAWRFEVYGPFGMYHFAWRLQNGIQVRLGKSILIPHLCTATFAASSEADRATLVQLAVWLVEQKLDEATCAAITFISDDPSSPLSYFTDDEKGTCSLGRLTLHNNDLFCVREVLAPLQEVFPLTFDMFKVIATSDEFWGDKLTMEDRPFSWESSFLLAVLRFRYPGDWSFNTNWQSIVQTFEPTYQFDSTIGLATMQRVLVIYNLPLWVHRWVAKLQYLSYARVYIRIARESGTNLSLDQLLASAASDQ